MSISLANILSLVGKLDDSLGDETSRERFRSYLKENVIEVGQVRDYVEECLRRTGDQYNRVLQDLVNYIGNFLGFTVTYGRYSGIKGAVGFDGLWESPTGLCVVVEVKTTEAYAIKTATLVGYVDALISEKKISNWDTALGLYVIGRPDPELRQLENGIIAEKRIHQLRIMSVESLLSLAEMMNEYDIEHKDILAIIKPSKPTIDSIVGLMARLVAEPKKEEIQEELIDTAQQPKEEERAYWISPVKSDDEQTAEECIKILVGQEHIYAFGERTPGRKHLKPGDMICFYATGNGVIAHGEVSSIPNRKKHTKIRHPEKFKWVFSLRNTKLYLNKPIVIDPVLRFHLDAFKGRDPNKSWAWFVQATRKISKHDFELLIH